MCSVSQVASQSENASAGQSGEVKFHLVDEAPAPRFARLNGLHDRVLGGVEVFRRVLVL
jgi:hypothetical protein